MSLGENIYKLRTERKMSQEDFAAAMEVSRQSVSKWENDMAVPELEKLVKMAKLFEVSLDELVGNIPRQHKQEPSPHPSPAHGISTGDLISVMLLLLGIILPIILFFCGLSYIGLFAVPPFVTLCASFCSPKSKLLLHVFGVYNIICASLVFFMVYPLGWFAFLLYVLPFGYWSNKQNS